MLRRLALASLLALLPCRAAHAEALPPHAVRLVYTGGTGGLSSGQVDFEELWPFFRDLPPRDFQAGGFVQDNAFRQGALLVYTPQGPLTLQDFAAFLAAGPIAARSLGPVKLLTTDYAHVVDLQPPAAGLGWPLLWLRDAMRAAGSFQDVRTTGAMRSELENAQGVTLEVLDLAGAPLPDLARFRSVAGWEMLPGGGVTLTRPAASGGRGRVLAIGRPLGDGVRRAGIQHAWRDEAPEATLAIDLGNMLEDGYTELSLRQRALTLSQVGAMRLDALVPGETELGLERAEWDALAASAPVLAANLAPADPTRPRPRGVLTRVVNGVKVAIVGLVDDRAAIAAGVTGPRAAWQVTDPFAAATAAIVALGAPAIEDDFQAASPSPGASPTPAPQAATPAPGASPAPTMGGLVGGPAAEAGPPAAATPVPSPPAFTGPPDLVILATNVKDERLQALRQINGAHAVVADLAGLPGDVFTETITLAGQRRARSRSSYLVARSSPNRVGALDTVFRAVDGRLGIASMRNEARLAVDTAPDDPVLRAELNAIRDRYQRERRELLLPDLRDAEKALPGFPRGDDVRGAAHVDRSLWRRLIANVARTGTAAEVAIVRVPPMKARVVGPVSRLVAEGWLEVGDRVVQVALPGKALKAIAGADAATGLLAFAGYDVAAATILGTPIADDELYQVTTTDHVLHHPRFFEAFTGRRVSDRWKPRFDGIRLPDGAGEPLALRELVVGSLVDLKARHQGAFDPPYVEELAGLFAAPGAARDSRCTIRVEDGELLFNGIRGAADPTFSQVRVTRANAPSSQALGGKGKLAVLHDSPDWALENRARAAYKRTTITKDGVDTSQENEDEIVLTSEFRFKRLAIPAGPAPLTPLLSWNYTTEFKPDEVAGVPKPRRAELAAILGALYAPGFGFKECRAGLAFKNDFANQGAIEPGLYLAGGFEQVPFPAFPIKVRGGVEAFRYYSFTPVTDTPDRLGLQATLTGGLAIPLWERFTLNLGADWFLFSGKVPATSHLASNLDFKVGLGYTLAWKPFYGVWF